MCLCLSKLLFYHCPSSFFFFPLLSFFLFPLTRSLSESLTPIALQLKLLHSQFIFLFLSSCLSACTCVHVGAHVSSYKSLSLSLSLSFLSFDSAFAAKHLATHKPPPHPPNCLGGTQHSTLQLKKTFCPKMCFFLRIWWTCWICSKAPLKKCFFLGKSWICWMFLELKNPFWAPHEGDTTFNITVEKKKHLFQKCAFFAAEMLHMLNMFESLSLGKRWICWMFLELIGLIQKGSVSSKSIQHIQHIQHCPRKKHIFRIHSTNTFNTFRWKKHIFETICFSQL